MNKNQENSLNSKGRAEQPQNPQTSIRLDEKHMVSRTGKIILSTLQDTLILFKMKTWNKGDYEVANLKFTQDWKIITRKGSRKYKELTKKWPVDVSGNLWEFSIPNTRKKLFETINNDSTIEDIDRKLLIDAINQFIEKNFIESRRSLEKKNGKYTIHYRLRNYYTELSKKQNLPPKEQLAYKDVCITLANMLYESNPSYLNQDWSVNERWENYLAKVFKIATDHIPDLGGSKAFHKIFHDGDFNFLKRRDPRWNPRVGTFHHYVQVVSYLVDSEAFNAYEEGGASGRQERIEQKDAFLNWLYVASKLGNEELGENKDNSDKVKIHNYLAQKRRNNNINNKSKQPNRTLEDRPKGLWSKLLKIGGRTNILQDESWLRATYYWDIGDKKKINQNITSSLKKYLQDILISPGIRISNISFDKKGDFVSEEDATILIQELQESFEDLKFSKRIRKSKGKDKLESVISKYTNIIWSKPTRWMQAAYQIANGKISRGWNGKYADIKFNITLAIDAKEYNKWVNKDQQIKENMLLEQEVSYYPFDNDLNMGHHEFLDLEKKIFHRVKNMNNAELWKSISLNRLRYFTEATIKDISFLVDIYEEKIRRKELPEPKNDNYKFLKIDGKRMSLKDMVYRNKDNSDRFDKMIAEVLNYFIKQNKLIYLNQKSRINFWLIQPEQLKIENKANFKSTRFTTSDVLKTIAKDAKYLDHSICFYTPDESRFQKNFYQVNLGDLWNMLDIEETIK